MNVFVAGASGLIGSRLVDALLAGGHRVTVAGRRLSQLRQRWPDCTAVEVDYTRDHAPATWVPRLRRCDAVVNTVGIFAESGGSTFDGVHALAPMALFAACLPAGVGRVVQLSALGADEEAGSRFHQSKRRADAFLLDLPLQGSVVRPSLVFDPAGASTRALCALAMLPLLPLPDGGRQRVQPVALDDLVGALVHLLLAADPPREIDAVGPRCIALREYLALLRQGLGGGALRSMGFPAALAPLLGRFAPARLSALGTGDAMAMLARGNCAESRAMRQLLGRPLRDPRDFVRPADAPALRREARLAWLLPLLRTSVGLVWLATATVSFGLFPPADSFDLLHRAGVPPALAPLALYGAATLDLVLGCATLFAPRRWRLYGVQALLILAYTAIISVRLPGFWLHPYGPLTKNLPLLAAIATLAWLEED